MDPTERDIRYPVIINEIWIGCCVGEVVCMLFTACAGTLDWGRVDDFESIVLTFAPKDVEACVV